jgi:hypothetical protein
MHISYFFAGALLCNCIPHLASGLCGLSFPTPFAKPRGVGRSSALLNFVWGFSNVLFGVFLLVRHPLILVVGAPLLIFVTGVFVMGAYLSTHFAKVQARGQAGLSTGTAE